jgi:hypothetical protein
MDGTILLDFVLPMGFTPSHDNETALVYAQASRQCMAFLILDLRLILL